MVAKMFRNILILLVVICGGCLFTCCRNTSVGWRLDEEYSESLTINASSLDPDKMSMLLNSIDAVRVYRVKGKSMDMLSLNELFANKLYCETKDKNIIKDIIASAQEVIDHVDNCFENRGSDIFHVVVLDNSNRRAGYFLVVPCISKEEVVSIVHPLQRGGASSIYYNRSLLKIIYGLQT